jgi:hypothetical protein
MLVGASSKPAAEIELAFEMRKIAIESIQKDARAAKGLVSGFVNHPLDTAAEKLLIPAITSILRSHRPRKADA